MLYLIVAAGLLIWGVTLLRSVLRGWLFIGYWLACFLCAFLALVIAWLDMRAIRRHARAERRALLERALAEASRSARKQVRPKDLSPGGAARHPPETHA